MQQAQGSVPPVNDWQTSDRWFVPAVMAIAIATFIIWFNIMGNVTMALITTCWSADYRLSVRARFSHTNLTRNR